MCTNKPMCDPGDYGENVYMVIARTMKALRRANMDDKADEFNQRAKSAHSYEEVWGIAAEYVEFV